MKDDWLKWIYTFVLLGATLGWGVFCLECVKWAITSGATVDIIAAAGVNVVLGVMLAMAKDVNQFWFRKAKEDKNVTNITAG